jgi:hypothetical protein
MEVEEEQELTKVEEVVNQFLIEELKSEAYESERILNSYNMVVYYIIF